MTGTINKIIGICFLLFLSISTLAQERLEKSVFLTGVVLDAEEGTELPYVHVRIRNSLYGTATDVNGYFSIFMSPGDTLDFSYVGYVNATFVMPFELEQTQYSLLQLLRKDTVMLEEVVIFPWPDYQNFVDAFLDVRPEAVEEDELIVEVKRNIGQAVEMSRQNKYYYDQQRYQRLFIMHEIFPPNHFLDPGRWADFIRELRDDDD